MHYFKRNIGDYHKKAGRLSMLQHGAYTLLLDSCYDRETFPTMDEAIEWVWASTEDEIQAVKFVIAKFFELEDEVYVQHRVKNELEQYHKNSATNKRIAMEREAKRKDKRTKRAQDVNEAPPNQQPITINQQPVLRDLSESNDSNPQPQVEPVKKKCSSVPYDEILQLYLKILVNTGEPMGLIAVQVLTAARKTKIRQYWTANGKKGLDGVEAYFNYIWTNRNSHSWIFGCAGRNWKADIAYLLKEDTVARARENTLGNWSNDQ